MSSRGWRTACATVICAVICARATSTQELQRGVILDDVKCLADPTQSYSLYLPSNYSPDRKWSVLIGFHPGGRGRAIVEKYRAAAEQYGYVIAGSNNSRNGPWSVSMAAIRAMVPDLNSRFSLDERRVYLTGHSGGARVAMQVALASNSIAGVIASSGGYPDSQPRAKVGFAVFSTAGNEDFNYIEMRMLDRRLTSPHRLAVFTGGHTLPPDAVALEAVEWMELQAMKSGRRTRDDGLVTRLLEKRQHAIAEAAGQVEAWHLLDALVADFDGLRDVGLEKARAQELSTQAELRKALAWERATDDAEARMMEEYINLEAGLSDESRHTVSLLGLRDRLSKLARKAAADDDSPERSQARRMLRALTAGAAERVSDPEYRTLLQQFAARGR